MPRIEVDTGVLSQSAAEQASIASSLTAVQGRLSAETGMATAAGAPAAVAAITTWCSNWVDSVGATADSVSGLGANTQAAASAYLTTDAGAIP